MTLREITQRVLSAQQLAERDPAAALTENRALFLDLTRQNKVYIVPETIVSDEVLSRKHFRPYIASAHADDHRLFLRIFSHEDAATAFAEKKQQNQVVKIDGVELMQLAKYYFLEGGYGFLLNDGLAWATISFPDFLEDCFSAILGDPALARTEYVVLMQLINMVRQNHFYKLVVARQVMKSAQAPEKLFFMDPFRRARLSATDFVFEELTLPKLLQCAQTTESADISIRTEKMNSTVSSSMLRAALCAAGLTKAENVGFNENPDFHLDSVALDFRIQDFQAKDGTVTHDFQLAELPSPHDKAPPSPRKKSLLERGGEKVRTLLARLKQGKTVNEAPDATAKEPLFQEQPKRPKSMILILKSVFLLFFLCVVGFTAIHFWGESPERLLRENVAAGDYAKVDILYAESVAKSPKNELELLEFMTNDLTMRLDSYAAGTGSAKDLTAAIEACRKIPKAADFAELCFQRGAALEQSKRSYEKGLQETSVLSRLDIWRAVTQEDLGSQTSMAENLRINASNYKYTVFLEADAKKSAAALSSLMLLQSYYPQDADISAKIRSLQSSTTQNSSGGSGGGSLFPTIPGLEKPTEDASLPIRIQRLTCKPFGLDGRIDLYIDWTNTSGKQIKEIDFEVIPYNRRNEPMTTKIAGVDGNLYSRYLARDLGPFEANYKTSAKHVWEAAWTNVSIEKVRIDKIYIFFAGEDAPVSILDATDIETLFDSDTAAP